MKLPVQPPSFSLPKNLFSLESLNSPTVQTVIIILLIFVFVVLMALGRRILIHSSLKGVWAGFIMGLLTIGIIEGGLLYLVKEANSGSGVYVPSNLRALLDSGKKNFTQVLGVQTERQVPTAQSVILDYQVLSKLDSELARGQICEQKVEAKGQIR